MTVYLGEAGHIELTRNSSTQAFAGTVRPSDVNDKRDRFSFDFPSGMLLTGDYIQIKTTDGSLLSFVDASGWGDRKQHPDGTFFVYADPTGGLLLYRDFQSSVNNDKAARVGLVVPTRNVPVSVQVLDIGSRCLGQVTSYEFSNERETVDVSALGDSFRERYSSLISGSGRIEAFFSYTIGECGAEGASRGSTETSSYLHQLILRQQLGSTFKAKLYLISRGASLTNLQDEIWYEIEGVLTNCGIAFAPGEGVRSTFDFVTTGEIHLRSRFVTNYLVQEQDGVSRLILEQSVSDALELEQQE